MSPHPPMPQTFGRYTLVERIASGGMAEVFRAKAFGVAGFEKTVAIKRILPNFVSDEGFVRMFLREANVAVKLSHANVVQVFELGRVGEDYYIALEFVEGRDLKTIVRKSVERRAAIPPDVAAFIAQKVCAGLHHAHTATDDSGAPMGIVHRDVSPHNVLIAWSGEVKVADFGIAKLASAVRHTVTGTIKGKLAYMSPEQSVGDPDLDARSDVFAAGIVLFELLTGAKPFDGENDRELLRKIREAPTPLPSEEVPGVPRELDVIVSTAMAKRREDRYQDASQMARALATFLQKNGSATGRLIDESTVAEIVRELCGPRPATAVSSTPPSRGNATPVLAPDASGGSTAMVQAAFAGIRPIPAPDEAVEVFAAAASTYAGSAGAGAGADFPVSSATSQGASSDSRGATGSQATLVPGASTSGVRGRGALLLGAGVVGGAILVGGALMLGRGDPAAPSPATRGEAGGVTTPGSTTQGRAASSGSLSAGPESQILPGVPVAGTLRVTGTPSNATVTLDGSRTAKIGEALADIPFGSHVLTVSAEDYRAKILRLEVSAAEPVATPSVSLTRAAGEVRVGHGRANEYRLEIPGVIRPGQEKENRFEYVPVGRYKGTLLRGTQRWPVVVVVRDGKITKVMPPNTPAAAGTVLEFSPPN